MGVLWNQRSPPFSRAWVPNLTEHTPQQGSAFCLQWLRKRAGDHAPWGSFPEGTLLSPSLRGPTFLSGPRPVLLSFGFCSGSYPIFFQYCLCLCSFVLFSLKVASVGFCYLQPKNLNWHRKLHRMAQLFSAITQKAPERFSTVLSWVMPAENMNTAQLLSCTLFPPSARCPRLSSRGALSPQMLKWHRHESTLNTCVFQVRFSFERIWLVPNHIL